MHPHRMLRAIDRDHERIARRIEALDEAALHHDLGRTLAKLLPPEVAPPALLRGKKDGSTIAGPLDRRIDIEIAPRAENAPASVTLAHREPVGHRVPPPGVRRET